MPALDIRWCREGGMISVAHGFHSARVVQDGCASPGLSILSLRVLCGPEEFFVLVSADRKFAQARVTHRHASINSIEPTLAADVRTPAQRSESPTSAYVSVRASHAGSVMKSMERHGRTCQAGAGFTGKLKHMDKGWKGRQVMLLVKKWDKSCIHSIPGLWSIPASISRKPASLTDVDSHNWALGERVKGERRTGCAEGAVCVVLGVSLDH